ncbi:MAG: hypothetical protein A2Y64_08345 [Candidatus Coatesbacteria bacterium RBG_13_66_14]|uniref:SbsA Ig-like domain-containing protein n=1 Tax=Candidatus Coatesbacteria bacterium RBG_13_66_14 TaxID=1817816 RepID=A0A1F5EWU4_9BACT|nr:MAG: hypothetical protein A2Y64_08345 [Candidatus Coatesbacteria bacterium RBG_13_66_14]
MKKLVILLALMVVASFADQYDLMIAHCDPGSTSGVTTNIAGDPFYEDVYFVNCQSYTPTVAEMAEYGCVFTWSNYTYSNPTQMGNNLADYVDDGGTVVINDFSWTSGWGLQGRLMTDANYAPMTHNGSGAYSNTNLGSKDDAHPFMDGVSSITNIYYWTYVTKESPATWVADNTTSVIYCAVNADFNVAGVNMYPGDAKHWSGDGWILLNNMIQNLMEGLIEDFDPPYVNGMDPDDGEVDVPIDSTVVFHCVDDISKVDTDTIDFTVKDSTLTGSRTVSAGGALSVLASPARTLPGDLDIDDTDPADVVCTWTGADDFYDDVTITCTVDGMLADNRGNEMGDDFVWTFDTGAAVDITTWGAIKADF